MLQLLFDHQVNADSNLFTITIIVGAIIAALVLWLSFSSSDSKKSKPEEKPVEEKPVEKPKEEPKKVEKKEKAPVVKHAQEHHLLQLAALKGHKEDMLFVAACSSYVVTSSLDRTIQLFEVPTIGDKVPKSIRVTLPFDSASAGCFSQDGSHIILGLRDSRDVIAYRIVKKEKTSVSEVQRFKTPHKDSIRSISISSNSKIIITSEEETTVYLWSLKGVQLASVNTSQLKNNMSTISPDNNLFAVTAWTGDVKIWAISWNKETNEFQNVTKAMDLGEHKSTVYCASFSSDSKMVATTSKDGTLKVWKVDVKWLQREDPKCVTTISCPLEKKTFNLVAISPDKKCIATTISQNIYFYSLDGKLQHTIEKAHEDGTISSLVFAADSSFVVTCTQMEHGAKVWKNPVNLK